MSILCRPASSADIPALARIRSLKWGDEGLWLHRIGGYLAGTYHPQKALEARAVFVVVEDAEIIGFIAGHLSQRFDLDGELQWINVLGAHRGSGAATLLLHRLARWFLQQNARSICVNCSPENPRAVHFYRRHGAAPRSAHWLAWDDVGQVLST